MPKCPPLPILHADNEVFLIDKPAGLAVQGGAGITHSVDRLLAAKVGEKVYPVHRLDRDTSGLLLVARSPAAAAKWTALIAGPTGKGGLYCRPTSFASQNIAAKAVRREYQALCIGGPTGKGGLYCRPTSFASQNIASPASSGIITAPLAKDGVPQKAVTRYTVIETFVPSPPQASEHCSTFTLMSVVLETGRTHQIRRHLALIHCPIAGDDKYGDFPANRHIAKAFGIKKLTLTAHRITLPLEGGERTFEASLPPHFAAALDILKKTR
jgi:23S rRNA pseudouridine955/2504/2580 synthase